MTTFLYIPHITNVKSQQYKHQLGHILLSAREEGHHFLSLCHHVHQFHHFAITLQAIMFINGIDEIAITFSFCRQSDGKVKKVNKAK